MTFTDSHAHLTAPPLSDHVEEILQRAQQHRVSKIVNICTDLASLEKGLVLSQRHPWVMMLPPHLRMMSKKGRIFFPHVSAHRISSVAIGETGLDYYYEHSPRDLQKESLLSYFALAHEAKLPLIFHCRNAFSDLFDMADAHMNNTSAVLHCFTGTPAEAKACIDRGWLLSINGIVTFKKSAELRDVVRLIPLDQLLIETDAPYLAPQSKRGKLNEPGYLPETAALIAQIKGITIEKLAEATAQNAQEFFSFPKPPASI